MKHFFGRISGEDLERIKTKKIKGEVCLSLVMPVCKTLICKDCIKIKINILKKKKD